MNPGDSLVGELEPIAEQAGSVEGSARASRPSATAGLTVEIDRDGEVVRVVPTGELDLATASLLEERLASVETDGVTTILVDMARVPFMDSSGLQVLLREAQRVDERGQRLVLDNCPAGVRRVFELTGTAGLLEGIPFSELARSGRDEGGSTGAD